MLKAERLNVYYDELQALIDVSIEVHEGEFLVVIGLNGAGKTTFLKTVSGLIRPREGTILWKGEAIEKWPTDDICRLGIIHVPEGRKLFPQMTVLENLAMGAYLPAAKNQARETRKKHPCRPVGTNKNERSARFFFCVTNIDG
jgi:branched-chain amino acid transport system ATP-binding protein